MDQINRWYACKLCEDDIEFSKLNIETVQGESVFSFRFKKNKINSDSQFKSIVFEQTGPVYIGFDIINNSFKYCKPQRGLVNGGELNVHEMAESIIQKKIGSK